MAGGGIKEPIELLKPSVPVSSNSSPLAFLNLGAETKSNSNFHRSTIKLAESTKLGKIKKMIEPK